MLNGGKMAESCLSVRLNVFLLVGAQTICWLRLVFFDTTNFLSDIDTLCKYT